MEVPITIFESLVWLDLGLNSGLPSHWRTLYPLDQSLKSEIVSYTANGGGVG